MFAHQNLGAFLARVCVQTYVQYFTAGYFLIPPGYRLLGNFQTVIHGSTEWFGYIIESSSDIIVAFRGTLTPDEWTYDFFYPQKQYYFVPCAGNVHAGFLSIYVTCRNKVLSVLRRVSASKKLYITGHSLGGALALISAPDIAVNTNFRQPVVVTFGAPRVGDPGFAVTYNKVINSSFRIVNTHDTVPRVPFKVIIAPGSNIIYFYRHVKKALKISFQTESIRGNHNILNYLKHLKKVNANISSKNATAQPMFQKLYNRTDKRRFFISVISKNS
ncbi:MAG: lipase family protein [Clostridiales bacterium]|nr:lipase family protein [Clostridiales bacterium]MCF8022209.1 lipase family protein [Clostridiales bacterium]